MMTIKQFCDTHHACAPGVEWALANCKDMPEVWARPGVLKTSTEQEVFDFVVTSLLRQGQKSYVTNEYGVELCRYRSPGGKKCAAGFLIPDDQYTDKMESRTSFQLQNEELFNFSPHEKLVDALQCAHDTSGDRFCEDFSSEARSVATRFNLSLDAIKLEPNYVKTT